MPKLSHPLQIRWDALCEIADLLVRDPEWGAKIERAGQQYYNGFAELDNVCSRWMLVPGTRVSPQVVDEWFSSNFESTFADLIKALSDMLSAGVYKSPSLAHELAIAVFNNVVATRLGARGISVLKSKNFYPSTVVFQEGDPEPTAPSFPWIEVRPLQLKIMPWSALFKTRAEVLSQVRMKLTEYEKRFKTKHYRERPTELKKHAGWWIEHYIKCKSYETIATDDYSKTELPPRSDDNDDGDHLKNIQAAVKKLSKILDPPKII